MIAVYYEPMTENEDDEPVGEMHPLARDPHDAFRAIAERGALIRVGAPLDQNLLDFASGVVEFCASIGDRYGDNEAGDNAGEHIRAGLLS